MPVVSTALIVGGGIAGLASAVALSRVGVKCEVIEKSNPNEGASLGISGRAADALVELGIYDMIYKAGTPFPHDSGVVDLRDSAGNVVLPGPRRPLWDGAKEGVGIYRPALIDVLTKVAVELGVKIRPDTTFTEIENGADQVSVKFTAGDEGTYDLLIGADGINSATRKVLFPDAPVPTYAGQLSIRWMAPGARVQPEGWYKNDIGRMGFYHLPEGLVYVPSVFTTPNERLSDEETRELFTKFLDAMTAPAVVELRSRLTPESDLIARPFRWLLVPDTWYKNRSILIGDAAHATTAHMGMGGGMALEDAVVLGQSIRDAKTVKEALDAFMARRFDRVSTVVHTSVGLSKLEQEGAHPKESKALIEKAFASIGAPY